MEYKKLNLFYLFYEGEEKTCNFFCFRGIKTYVQNTGFVKMYKKKRLWIKIIH